MDDAAEAVKKALLETPSENPEQALFLIGPGNNGADGWLVLCKWHKALVGQGKKPNLLVHCPEGGNSDMWRQHKAQAQALGFRQIDEDELLNTDWHRGYVIDAVYGTGLSRDVPEHWIRVFRRLRRSRAVCVSVDIPSGLDPDRGVPRGMAFRAQLTVTFGAAKPGLLIMEGPAHAGKVRIAPLRFPRELVREIAVTHSAFGQKSAAAALPERPLTGHKGTFGHVVLLCGSPEFRGAGILAGEAALRVGTGYVHIVAGPEVYPDILKLPEALYFEPEAFFSKNFDFAKTVFVVGPGLSDRVFLRRALEHLEAQKAEKVILDAEALNELPGLSLAKPLPAGWILTPHPGELSRLTAQSANAINEDRCRAARMAQSKWGGVVLLKGFRTVIAYEGKITILLSGNSALAKAGSGDVLAGLLAGLYAQMNEGWQAAALAAYVHGRIASLHVRKGGDPASLIPSDLIQAIDPVLAELRHLE